MTSAHTGDAMAGLYWDSEVAPGLRAGGVPEDVLVKLRDGYLRDVAKSEPAQAALNEWYENPKSHVMISMREYKNLLHRSKTLGALRSAGVNNWDGYGIAMNLLYGNDDD